MGKNVLHRNKEGEKASNIKLLFKKLVIVALVFGIVINIPMATKVSKADSTTVVGVKIDYIEEMAYLTPGNGGSTKFYISTDNQKTWDMLDSNAIDISSLLTAKPITVYFRGNKDTVAYPQPLQSEDKSLKVTYTITAGVGKITYQSGFPVEYRKGPNGAWKPAISGMPTSIYELKGTTLFFRTAAKTDTRAGKIVNVKVPKKPSAPSVRFDGSKLCITGLKAGVTQYRVGDNVWTTFMPTSSSNKNSMDVSALLGGNTSSNLVIPAGVIEFRTAGSDKKLHSAVKVMEIPLQPTMLTTLAAVSGSALTITDNTKTAYEYTIVAKDLSLNVLTAKWVGISANKTVIVPKVGIGDKILVRIKSTTDSKTKLITPASTYIQFTVTAITPK